MSYAFLFRTQPDIDHMGPLAWKLVERGEDVHALISPGYDASSDPHLHFLNSYERFHLHDPCRAAGGVATALRCTLPYAFLFLRRHRPQLLAVEWGSGPRVSRGSSRWARANALGRRFVGSLLAAHRRDPQQMRSNLILAATLTGLPVVCLPHGGMVKTAGIKLRGPQAERFEHEGTIDWRDRNRFAAYVYDTVEHCRWHLDHALGDPAVLQAWGSLRWSPEWFELNRGLFEPFSWPTRPDQLRVAFMVPNWTQRVSPEAARDLLKRLQELDFVSVVVKAHPRKAGSLQPLRDTEGIDWTRVRDVSTAGSVPVIGAADVVIDVGSSIGLEVVMQGKVLLNAAFLHEVTTVFDEIEGTCVRAESCDEAVSYLTAHAAGSPHRVSEAAMSELLRRCVYAESPPFDVADRYADRVRALAESRGN